MITLRLQPLLPYIKCPQAMIAGKSNYVQTDVKSPLSVDLVTVVHQALHVSQVNVDQ